MKFALAILLAATAAAHASTLYTYEVEERFLDVGSNQIVNLDYMVTSPTLGTDLTWTADQIDVQTPLPAGCSVVGAEMFQQGSTIFDDTTFAGSCGNETQATDFTGSMNMEGIYSNFVTGETVSIRQITVAATPEPSSILLFGTGILGFAGIMKRKLTS